VFLLVLLLADTTFSKVSASNALGSDGINLVPVVRTDSAVATADAIKTFADAALRKIDDGTVMKAIAKDVAASQVLTSLMARNGTTVVAKDVYNPVFLAAASSLLVAFIGLNVVLHYNISPDFSTKSWGGRIAWTSVNFLFLFSALLYIQGFALVISDVGSAFDKGTPTSIWLQVMIPLYTKIIAAVFLMLQPLTAILTQQHLQGVSWSNFAGSIIFHIGNCLSLALSLSNTMISPYVLTSTDKDVIYYIIGTALLVTANHMVVANMDASKVALGPAWFQIGGSLFLLLGSLRATFY